MYTTRETDEHVTHDGQRRRRGDSCPGDGTGYANLKVVARYAKVKVVLHMHLSKPG